MTKPLKAYQSASFGVNLILPKPGSFYFNTGSQTKTQSENSSQNYFQLLFIISSIAIFEKNIKPEKKPKTQEKKLKAGEAFSAPEVPSGVIKKPGLNLKF